MTGAVWSRVSNSIPRHLAVVDMSMHCTPPSFAIRGNHITDCYFDTVPGSSPTGPRRSPSPRPTLRGTRSFSRLEPAEGNADPLQSSLTRLQTDTAILDPGGALASPEQLHDADENKEIAYFLPDGFDELPPELANLADRYF